MVASSNPVGPTIDRLFWKFTTKQEDAYAAALHTFDLIFFVRPQAHARNMLIFLVIFDVVWVVSSYANPHVPRWEVLGMPLLATAIGYISITVLKNWTRDDVDEVWLDRDALIIKSHGVTSRVAFSDLTDAVDATLRGSGGAPPRLRLTLRSGASSLGDSVSFLAGGAPGPFGPLDSKSILVMLKQRIDEARQSSG